MINYLLHLQVLDLVVHLFIKKKKLLQLIQCSGGGGGWSSEIIKAPSISNSFYKNRIKNNKIVIPIKKIVLTTKNTNYHNNSNIRQKMLLKILQS